MSSDDAVNILQAANQKILETAEMMDGIENGIEALLEHTHTLLELIEELEKDRNQWQAKYEEMEALYQRAAARAANLAAKLGQGGCPDCGSERVEYLEDGPGASVHCKECGFSEAI